MNLKKQIDFINSEGTILSLYNSKNKEYYLSSLINESVDTIYFKVEYYEIRMYVNGYITLNELYNFSDNLFIFVNSGNSRKTYFFKQYECSLTFGDMYYDEINEDMKPKKGLEKYIFKHSDE